MNETNITDFYPIRFYLLNQMSYLVYFDCRRI